MGLLSFRKAPSARKPSIRPNLPVAVPQDDAPTLGAAPAPAAAASAAAVPPIDADTAPLLSLHLLGASDLPRLRHLSNLGKLSPFVVAWVLDHTGARVGEVASWPVRPDTRQPVWNAARELQLPPMAVEELRRALLHVEVWDLSLIHI